MYGLFSLSKCLQGCPQGVHRTIQSKSFRQVPTYYFSRIEICHQCQINKSSRCCPDICDISNPDHVRMIYDKTFYQIMVFQLVNGIGCLHMFTALMTDKTVDAHQIVRGFPAYPQILRKMGGQYTVNFIAAQIFHLSPDGIYFLKDYFITHCLLGHVLVMLIIGLFGITDNSTHRYYRIRVLGTFKQILY